MKTFIIALLAPIKNNIDFFNPQNIYELFGIRSSIYNILANYFFIKFSMISMLIISVQVCK